MLRLLCLASLWAVMSLARASCGAAFCPVNTSWDVQGPAATEGSRFDLRYERVDQAQPRSSSHAVGFGTMRRHHDEIETSNRNWIATYDRSFGDWGVSASVPVVDRQHAHIHNHRGAALYESWEFRAVGDLRFLGRLRLSTTEGRDPPSMTGTGLQFGLKLPTGRIDVRNGAGALAERSLQPGTGTTDLLFGGFVTQSLPLRDLSWFAQGLLQLPVTARAGYRPGRRATVDAGLRYDASEAWSLMLQANLVLRARDGGTQAEPADTGGSALWVGPGASYAVRKDVRAYGFVQAPVAQHVNGVQITARRTAVVGVSVAF